MTINISEELPARKNAPAVAAKSSAKKGDAKGGTPQENSAKRIRQAVYDIRYRARREDIDLRKAYSEYMANSNLSPQEKTAVREKLFGKQGGGVSEQYMVTSVDWAEKNFAEAYHKVFFEGIKKEEPAIELVYEQELAEEPERKYKVRVFDPKSEKSYVRFATREKISRLRAKGLKVEMTEHGEAYEGERKKGEQTAAAMGGGQKKEVKEGKLDPVGKEDGDVNNDGKEDDTDDYLMNRRKAVGKAIAKKKGKKNVSEQSVIDQIKDLRKKAGVDYENDPNMVNTAPGIYRSKSAIEADKPLQQRLKELPSNVKRRQVEAAREKKMMAAPIPEEFITDGATGTTSTEGQNAREIDVLPDKVAKKLQQVTVMPQDGTNPQVGKAPLMMSQEMEGEQLTEEEEDRRERYAFMNVARNLVRAKTGAKRPIAMDPEGTYKKAKEDLAKMVNSGNPDKDKEETPCEEKQLSMTDTIKKIVENAGVKEKDAADKDAAEKKLESKKETTKPTEKPKSKDDTTGGYTIPDDAKPKTRLNTTTKSDTTEPTTKPSSGGQVKSSGPSGAASGASSSGRGGLTDKERISRVDAGKDPYPMLSQDAKLRMSLGIKDIESVSPFKDEKGNGGHAAFMAQFGLKPYGTQPDNLGRNNPTDMPRPNAAVKKDVTPKKDDGPKVKTEGKQLSMADTFLSIASAPKEDTEQLDEFLGPQAAENVKTLLDRGRKVFDRLGIPNNKTKKPMPGSGTPNTEKADRETERLSKNRMRQAGY